MPARCCSFTFTSTIFSRIRWERRSSEAIISRAILAGLLLAGVALPAWGHAFLEKASPAAGANLRVHPAKVELHFSEMLEPAFSGVIVTDMDGHNMNGGPAAVNGTAIVQPLAKLGPGRYRVTWHAVSVDTHRTSGKYNFLVLP